MLSDVRLVGGRTLYFPFLDDKHGGSRSIRDEAAWIVFYSLLADRVLLPPSAAFEGRYALQNLTDLKTIKLLDFLVLQGAIVSSSSKPGLRDFRDLFEAYSGSAPLRNPLTTSPVVYSRDELLQRKVYSNYLSQQLPLRIQLSADERARLSTILAISPRHADFEAMAAAIPSIELNTSTFQSEAAVAYFLAGAATSTSSAPSRLCFHLLEN
jgi:hypothetical protein